MIHLLLSILFIFLFVSQPTFANCNDALALSPVFSAEIRKQKIPLNYSYKKSSQEKALVVLLPGLSMPQMDHLVGPVSALNGLSVATMDLINTGRSPLIGAPKPQEDAQVVQQFLNFIDPKVPVILVGHSRGALVASLVAGNSHNQIEGVLGINPHIEWLSDYYANLQGKWAFWMSGGIMNPFSPMIAGFTEGYASFLSDAYAEKRNPDRAYARVVEYLSNYLGSNWSNQEKEKVRQKLIGMAGAHIDEGLQKFRGRVAFVTARHDQLVPFELVRTYSAKRNFQFIEEPKAGHMLPYDQPELFVKYIEHFLNSIL